MDCVSRMEVHECVNGIHHVLCRQFFGHHFVVVYKVCQVTTVADFQDGAQISCIVVAIALGRIRLFSRHHIVVHFRKGLDSAVKVVYHLADVGVAQGNVEVQLAKRVLGRLLDLESVEGTRIQLEDLVDVGGPAAPELANVFEIFEAINTSVRLVVPVEIVVALVKGIAQFQIVQVVVAFRHLFGVFVENTTGIVIDVPDGLLVFVVHVTKDNIVHVNFDLLLVGRVESPRLQRQWRQELPGIWSPTHCGRRWGARLRYPVVMAMSLWRSLGRRVGRRRASLFVGHIGLPVFCNLCFTGHLKLVEAVLAQSSQRDAAWRRQSHVDFRH
mmetsp:Transcript_23088/g.54516  ORF Transcript_23088/g.54516 Transcript_23088/m.54516 type:complete len:328 (+) Transcript_23088:743-1726(+)